MPLALIIVLAAIGGVIILGGLGYGLWKIEQHEARERDAYAEWAYWQHHFWSIVDSINWNDNEDDLR
jgi:hypothetical protein